MDIIWQGLLVVAVVGLGLLGLSLLLRAPAQGETSESVIDIRPIAMAVPMPLWRRDRELRIAWCNHAFATALETKLEQILAEGREFAERVDESGARALAEKAKRLGQIQTATRSLTIKGERRRFRIHEMPLPGGHAVGFAEDVTDTHEVRQALERHVALNAAVIQSLSQPVAVFAPDRRLTLWNKAFLDLWRLDEATVRQELTFGELQQILYAKRLLPDTGNFATFRAEQEQKFSSLRGPIENIVHRPDGRTLRAIAAPHPDGGVQLTYEDLTDLLALERSRNISIAVQRAMLDALDVAIAVYGSDGRLAFANNPYLQLWGLPPTSIEDRMHIRDVIEAARPYLDNGRDWPRFAQYIQKWIMNGEHHMPRYYRKDGKVIEAKTSLLPDGAILLIYRDMTELVQAERILQERNEALQAADTLRTQFIAAASYELRTPLNALAGFAEMLERGFAGPLNAAQTIYLRQILDAAGQLTQLTNDMLDLAMVEAGKLELRPERFDLGASLRSLHELARRQAEEQQVALRLNIDEELGWILADERRIRQALFNLLTNALKATPPGGVVTLGAGCNDGTVFLWVHDTSDWMKAAANARDPFRPTREGTSLPHPEGLALVRSFARLHGGSVEIDHSVEGGARVTILLPLEIIPHGSSQE